MIPLSRTRRGLYRIRQIIGRRVSARLRDMGIMVGDTIEIVSPPPGPVIISKNNTRIGIGMGMSNRIIVEPVGAVDEKNQST